jgi:hypothetical protein
MPTYNWECIHNFVSKNICTFLPSDKKSGRLPKKEINSVNCIIRILRKNVYYERDIKSNSLHPAPSSLALKTTTTLLFVISVR